jgi:transcriptional regulator GlxA family with amidase domain
VDLLEAEPGKPWTVVDLARRVGLSTRALQYGFAAQVGQSPMTYLRQVRLQRADADLRSAADTGVGAAAGAGRGVAAIASRWGFTNFGRFAAAYRARYGRTPSETLRGAR